MSKLQSILNVANNINQIHTFLIIILIVLIITIILVVVSMVLIIVLSSKVSGLKTAGTKTLSLKSSTPTEKTSVLAKTNYNRRIVLK